jgi:hypothetical protein
MPFSAQLSSMNRILIFIITYRPIEEDFSLCTYVCTSIYFLLSLFSLLFFSLFLSPNSYCPLLSFFILFFFVYLFSLYLLLFTYVVFSLSFCHSLSQFIYCAEIDFIVKRRELSSRQSHKLRAGARCQFC